MPTTELVIFDCDGVLVDSETISIELEVEMFASIGWPLTPAEISERFMGRSEAVMLAAVSERLGGDVPDGFCDHWEKRYHDALRERLQPVSGVAHALDQIPGQVCVASSGRPELIELKLELCGLADFFGEHVFSAVQVTHGKPAPDLFLFAAARLGADPARCAVIEDSPVGVQAARAAGMRTYAYVGGIVSRDRLEGDGTVLFDDMRALPALLARVR